MSCIEEEDLASGGGGGGGIYPLGIKEVDGRVSVTLDPEVTGTPVPVFYAAHLELDPDVGADTCLSPTNPSSNFLLPATPQQQQCIPSNDRTDDLHIHKSPLFRLSTTTLLGKTNTSVSKTHVLLSRTNSKLSNITNTTSRRSQVSFSLPAPEEEYSKDSSEFSRTNIETHIQQDSIAGASTMMRNAIGSQEFNRLPNNLFNESHLPRSSSPQEGSFYTDMHEYSISQEMQNLLIHDESQIITYPPETLEPMLGSQTPKSLSPVKSPLRIPLRHTLDEDSELDDLFLRDSCGSSNEEALLSHELLSVHSGDLVLSENENDSPSDWQESLSDGPSTRRPSYDDGGLWDNTSFQDSFSHHVSHSVSPPFNETPHMSEIETQPRLSSYDDDAPSQQSNFVARRRSFSASLVDVRAVQKARYSPLPSSMCRRDVPMKKSLRSLSAEYHSSVESLESSLRSNREGGLAKFSRLQKRRHEGGGAQCKFENMISSLESLDSFTSTEDMLSSSLNEQMFSRTFSSPMSLLRNSENMNSSSLTNMSPVTSSTGSLVQGSRSSPLFPRQSSSSSRQGHHPLANSFRYSSTSQGPHDAELFQFQDENNNNP